MPKGKYKKKPLDYNDKTNFINNFIRYYAGKLCDDEAAKLLSDTLKIQIGKWMYKKRRQRLGIQLEKGRGVCDTWERKGVKYQGGRIISEEE